MCQWRSWNSPNYSCWEKALRTSRGYTMVCAYEQARLLITYFSNKLFSKRYRIAFASKAIGISWHKDVMILPSTTHKRVSLSSSRCCPLRMIIDFERRNGRGIRFYGRPDSFFCCIQQEFLSHCFVSRKLCKEWFYAFHGFNTVIEFDSGKGHPP